MDGRNLIETAGPLRRGGSGGTMTMTDQATGEALLAPARNRRSKVGPITGNTGKGAEGERVADGRVVCAGQRPDQVGSSPTGARVPYAGTSDPSQVTRDHTIRIDEPGAGRPFPVLSLVGGKWTTFRAFAEETTDVVLHRLGRTRQTSTRELPIGGSRKFPEDAAKFNALLDHLAMQFRIPKPRARILVERYGSKALAVAAHCSESADRPIALHSSYTVREIAYLADNEMVGPTLDILLRRTTIAISGQATAALVEEVAEIAGSVLGWEQARVKSEISLTITELLDHHGVGLCPLAERRC